jgi:hypothetical protein
VFTCFVVAQSLYQLYQLTQSILSTVALTKTTHSELRSDTQRSCLHLQLGWLNLPCIFLSRRCISLRFKHSDRSTVIYNPLHTWPLVFRGALLECTICLSVCLSVCLPSSHHFEIQGCHTFRCDVFDCLVVHLKLHSYVNIQIFVTCDIPLCASDTSNEWNKYNFQYSYLY